MLGKENINFKILHLPENLFYLIIIILLTFNKNILIYQHALKNHSFQIILIIIKIAIPIHLLYASIQN